MWIGFVWFMTELAGSYEHGNELWGSMKGGKSLYQPSVFRPHNTGFTTLAHEIKKTVSIKFDRTAVCMVLKLKFSAVRHNEFPSWWAAQHTLQRKTQTTGAYTCVQISMIQ